MTYSPNIPQPRDDLAVSQGDLLVNFQQLNTQFGVNHVAFDDSSADKGKHTVVNFVEQADDPETGANEYTIYSKEDASGDTELFARPPNNADSYQWTKDGAIFVGLLPFVAVNFSISPITIQGDSLGVDSITQPGSAGRYRVNFTAAVTAALAGNNDYFWQVSGFDNSSNPVISQVTNTGAYNTVVTDTYIQFDFKNQNNTLISGLTRASVVLWRVQ